MSLSGETCPARPVRIRDLDATRIVPNLYQGGVRRQAGCRLELIDADIVVILAPDADVKLKAKKVVKLPLLDDQADLELAEVLGELAVDLAEATQSGLRVLILCHEGRNRSGLLTALVLRELGMTGKQAIRHIRSKRPNALANQWFTDYLARLD